MIIFTFNINSYAITLPELSITSNHYSSGDKMTLDEVKNVEVDKTLQLYAVLTYGNDLYDPEHPDSMGKYVQQADLTGVIWTSNNNGIATVDNTGKVTGVEQGKAITTSTTILPKTGKNTVGIIIGIISVILISIITYKKYKNLEIRFRGFKIIKNFISL